MRISYNWLKDYLDLTIDPYQLADKLSLNGLEVEEITEHRLDFPKVVIGKVLSVEQHPNADKLKVCAVDVGEEKLSIICGAPNVAMGQVVAVAKEGATLPNGMKIKKTKIRGELSRGMICSKQELALEDKSEGIWVLEDNLTTGIALKEALRFETDHIFDIAVTPNRPDCLSHIGVAREVGAIVKQKLAKPAVLVHEMETAAKTEVEVKIECPETCPRYAARLMRNIKVGDSPSWLVRRLEAIGMRSINNVVDVTNYVMMETGQPLHAFDFDLLRNQKIIVRESKKNEKFVTLDEKEHTLEQGTVLICDGERPVAIGGIMGGLNSEVSQETVHVLLESAHFKAESIQKSARYLGLSTEASQRFERGVDPNGVAYAADRAAQLIVDLCGGELYKGIVDIYPRVIEPKEIPLDCDKINNLLGTDLSEDQMVELLESIDLQKNNGYILAPTFRPDLERLADLAEEVARLYGLDNIPAKAKMELPYNINRNELDYFVDDLKNTLTGMGLQEVVTGSMIKSEAWEEMTGQKIYPLLNPISADMSGMRNSLVPSLAQVIQHNINRNMKNLRLFEINRIYLPTLNLSEPPMEDIRLAIAICGKRENELWYASGQNTDFYDIKGIFESLFSKIFLDNWRFISYSNFVIQNEGLGVVLRNQTNSFLGVLNEKIRNYFEIDQEVFVGEISVRDLFENRAVGKKYDPIPRFPAVQRDLALIVDEEIEAGSLVSTITKKGGKLLKNVEIFDIYRGKQISPDKKSVALRLTFQSGEKTLTEETVNNIAEKIIQSVSKTHNAKLRE